MVKKMRQELGNEILLYTDANQGYDPFTAIKAIREMAGLVGWNCLKEEVFS